MCLCSPHIKQSQMFSIIGDKCDCLLCIRVLGTPGITPHQNMKDPSYHVIHKCSLYSQPRTLFSSNHLNKLAATSRPTITAKLGGGFVKCWITEPRFLPSISPFLHECQIEAYWDDGCVAAALLLPLTCQKLFLEWKMLIKTLSMLHCNETFIRPGCILLSLT